MHTVTLPFFSSPNLSIVSTLGTFHVRITIYIRGKEEGRAERSRQDRGIQPTFISGFKGRGEEDVLLCAEGKVGGQFIDRECTGGKIEDNRLHTPVNSWPAQRWNKYCSAMRKKKSGIKSPITIGLRPIYRPDKFAIDLPLPPTREGMLDGGSSPSVNAHR